MRTVLAPGSPEHSCPMVLESVRRGQRASRLGKSPSHGLWQGGDASNLKVHSAGPGGPQGFPSPFCPRSQLRAKSKQRRGRAWLTWHSPLLLLLRPGRLSPFLLESLLCSAACQSQKRQSLACCRIRRRARAGRQYSSQGMLGKPTSRSGVASASRGSTSDPSFLPMCGLRGGSSAWACWHCGRPHGVLGSWLWVFQR